MMVAIGIMLGLLIAIVVVVVPNFIRPHYIVPIAVTAPMGPSTLDIKIPGAWIISRDIVDKNGKVFDSFNSADWPPQCQQIIQQDQASGNGSGDIHVKAPGKWG